MDSDLNSSHCCGQEKEGEEKWEERCRRIRMRREEEERRSEKEKWREKEKQREGTGGRRRQQEEWKGIDDIQMSHQQITMLS